MGLLDRIEAKRRLDHIASCPQQRRLPWIGGTECLHYPYTTRTSTLADRAHHRLLPAKEYR